MSYLFIFNIKQSGCEFFILFIIDEHIFFDFWVTRRLLPLPYLNFKMGMKSYKKCAKLKAWKRCDDYLFFLK